MDPEKVAMDDKREVNSASSNGNVESGESIVIADAISDKALLRKLDLRVIPPLFTIFVMSYLDRTNIGNAKIQGLEKDLGMTGSDYSIALFIFFITYILSEVPSNLFLKRLNPSTWFCIIITCWGIVTVGQGLVKNFAGLISLRLVLGIFEAGVFPGGTYLMSAYYARYELQWRFSLFLSSIIIAGAFGGLLAFALAKLDGVGGYEGWRWIFIIEGIITAIIGVICKFWVVEWPDKVKWLTDDEKARLTRKLAADAGDADGNGARMDRLNKSAVRRIVTDWKIWLGILMHITIVTSTYSVSFFLPTVIKDMGFTSAEAQVRIIPVYLAATVVSLTCAWLTDRFRCRYKMTLITLIPGITGYGIMLAGTSVSVGVRYFACFLTGITAFTTLPTVLAWVNYQIAGHFKRAIGNAMILGIGNIGGIVGSNIWMNREAPLYRTGVIVSLVFLVSNGLLSTVYYFGLRRENRIRDSGGRDYRFTDEAEDLDNMGDDHPSWRFTF